MRFTSLRLSLSVVVVVCVAVMQTALIWQVQKSTYAANLEQQGNNLLSMARIAAVAVDDFAGQQHGKLRTLAQNPSVLAFLESGTDKEGMEQAALGLSSSGADVYGVVVCDREGKNLFRALQGKPTSLSPVSDRDYIKAALTGKDGSGEMPLKAKDTGKAVLGFAVPVRNASGSVVGCVGMTYIMESMIKRYIDDTAIGQTGYLYFLSEKGAVIAHKNREHIFKDWADKDFVRQSLASPKGVQAYDWEGDRKLQAWQQIPGLGWTVVAAMKESEIADATADLRRTLIIMGVAASALLVGVFIFVLVRMVVQPVRKLEAFVSEVAAGNLNAHCPLRSRNEIGALADAMRSLVETVRDITRRVEETSGLTGQGFLRRRVPEDGLRGGYLGLVAAINTWAGNMLMLLDKMPTPFIIRDKDRHIRFMNAAGGLGLIDAEKAEGMLCSEHYKSEICHTGQCVCDLALRTRKEEYAETAAHPAPGMDIDIRCIAVPYTEDVVCELILDQTDILKTQRQVVETAVQAERIAHDVAAASEDLSAQVEQASRGAEVQAQRVAETATAMEEMNSTVLEVAKNASNAADTSGLAKAKAEDGAGVVAQAIASIDEVRRVSVGLKDDMAALGKQAEGIGAVLNVISDIADQTNLLALNAAIEAARAGEAGRGFAVVADEVRKLAEKTMQATNEVGDAIRGIQVGARKNIANVEQAARKVEDATGLADRSGAALRDIVALVDQTTDQVRSIATASEQQSATSEEINRAIEEINRISTETSGAMRHSSRALLGLTEQAQELRSLVEGMKSEGDAGHGPEALQGGAPRSIALT